MLVRNDHFLWQRACWSIDIGEAILLYNPWTFVRGNSWNQTNHKENRGRNRYYYLSRYLRIDFLSFFSLRIRKFAARNVQHGDLSHDQIAVSSTEFYSVVIPRSDQRVRQIGSRLRRNQRAAYRTLRFDRIGDLRLTKAYLSSNGHARILKDASTVITSSMIPKVIYITPRCAKENR